MLSTPPPQAAPYKTGLEQRCVLRQNVVDTLIGPKESNVTGKDLGCKNAVLKILDCKTAAFGRSLISAYN